jgi:hypothetical protein
LDELWERYTKFKRPSLSPNTLDTEYATVERCIALYLPSKKIEDAIAIRDWAVAAKPPDAAKRFLGQFSACCDWALKSGLVSHNPFENMGLDIKLC